MTLEQLPCVVQRRIIALGKKVDGTFIADTSYFEIVPRESPLSVELIGFEAKKVEKGVLVEWKTSYEKNFHSYEIQRGKTPNLLTTMGLRKVRKKTFMVFGIKLRRKVINRPAPSSIARARIRPLLA